VAAARAPPGSSAPRRTSRSRCKYQDLGITHFVLSDTPYVPEIERQGNQLLPLLRE
jgi:alkanesulfonate monooxygenase